MLYLVNTYAITMQIVMAMCLAILVAQQNLLKKCNVDTFKVVGITLLVGTQIIVNHNV